MFKYYAIPFIAAAIIGLFILYFLEIIKFNKTGAKKFSFFRYFPYELNCFRRNNRMSWVYAIGLIVCVMLFTIPYIGLTIEIATSEFPNNLFPEITTYIIFVLALIGAISFCLLNFVKLSNYTLHLVLDALLVASNMSGAILSTLCFGTVLVDAYVKLDFIRVIIIVLGILNIIYMSILILNPSYKLWAKLVKYDADSYERPKFSYLPMIEWGNGIAYLINLAILCVAIYSV